MTEYFRVFSSMDRMLGFEPSGVGSIPARPAKQRHGSSNGRAED